LSGELDNTEAQINTFFNLKIPRHISGVPDDMLNPINTWYDLNNYKNQAEKLIDMFVKNFKKFENNVDKSIKNAAIQCRS
jgi:phosphoenolpyruvate carboxykinase (ATP)